MIRSLMRKSSGWRPALSLLVGFSVYVYVPLVPSASPMVSLGATDSFEGLRRVEGRMASLLQFQRTLYAGAFVAGVFVAGVLIVSVWSMASGWSEISLAGNDDSKSYAEATVAVGGVVLTEKPELFTLVYQAQVASPELDVMIVVPVMLQHDWYWDQLLQYYGDRMPPV